jgi:hypothetical protein
MCEELDALRFVDVHVTHTLIVVVVRDKVEWWLDLLQVETLEQDGYFLFLLLLDNRWCFTRTHHLLKHAQLLVGGTKTERSHTQTHIYTHTHKQTNAHDIAACVEYGALRSVHTIEREFKSSRVQEFKSSRVQEREGRRETER